MSLRNCISLKKIFFKGRERRREEESRPEGRGQRKGGKETESDINRERDGGGERDVKSHPAGTAGRPGSCSGLLAPQVPPSSFSSRLQRWDHSLPETLNLTQCWSPRTAPCCPALMLLLLFCQYGGTIIPPERKGLQRATVWSTAASSSSAHAGRQGLNSQSSHSFTCFPKVPVSPRVTHLPCEELTLTKARHSWTGLSSPSQVLGWHSIKQALKEQKPVITEIHKPETWSRSLGPQLDEWETTLFRADGSHYGTDDTTWYCRPEEQVRWCR